MEVDIASPLGGVVPVDPQSYLPVIRTRYDDRALKDGHLQKNLSESLAMEDIDIDDYDVIYFAGGWGAAFDLGFSETVGEKVTEANPGKERFLVECVMVRSASLKLEV